MTKLIIYLLLKNKTAPSLDQGLFNLILLLSEMKTHTFFAAMSLHLSEHPIALA